MKKSPLDYIGYLFGIIVAAVIVIAVVFLFRQPDWEGLSSVPTGRFQEEGTETVSGGIKSLSVKTIAGAIRINGSTGGDAVVRYVKSAPSQEALDDLQVQIDRQGDTLTVSTQRIRRGPRSRGSVSYEVDIPAGIQDIRAESVSGSVILSGLGEGIDQHLETVSGRIETNMSADLYARSVSGSIQFRFAGENLEARSISGRITGSMDSIDDDGSVNLGSTSGSVRLDVFPELDARVNMHSVSGSVKSDLPVSVTSAGRNKLEGNLGEGRIPLEIGTVSGSIRLQLP